MAFTASVPADQSSNYLADPVKGCELSYMALTWKREQTVYNSLLMLAGAVLADPEPMPASPTRGCVAMTFLT